jgi:methyl-accepting chemotaxis protein
MNKLSLKMKLAVAFGVLVVILAVVVTIAYRGVGSLDEAAETVARKTDEKELSLYLMGSAYKEQSAVHDFVLSSQEQTLKRDEEGQREFKAAIGKLVPLVHSEEGKRLFGEVQATHDAYRVLAEREIQLHRSGKTKEALELAFTQEAAAFNAFGKATGEFVNHLDQDQKEVTKQQDATVARSKTVLIGLGIAGIAIGLILASLVARSIVTAVTKMVAMIQEVAANNLAIEDMEIASHDELGQAASALNSMKNNLKAIVQSIASTAEHVASASEEISASATQMANGSETQKDQVHQIATAMQEMSSTVHEVSESCNKAADSARQTSETARQGGAIVEDTLGHMRSIAGSVRETAQKVQELGSRSDQIGKIVGVIDDIADQTNLLALNAAIEAARAGEQGRGFAVVADEVRKLAERTTKATKEIAEMIQSVQTETRGAVEKMQSGTQQVEKGVEVTAKAGESLKQIIGQAEHVGEMVTHIATAANEQSSATEQVNSNMDQINKLVAESAEGAQQSAQACEQLSGLAFELQNLVSRFKLGQQTSGGYRSPRQATADPGRVRTALALAPRPPAQHDLYPAGHDRNGD